MRWFKISPRIDLEKDGRPYNVDLFGTQFTFLLFKNQKDLIDIYLKTGVSKESLSKFFNVIEIQDELDLGLNPPIYVVRGLCNRRSYLFEYNFRIADLPSLISNSDPNSGVVFSASLDPKLRKIMYDEHRHAQKAKTKYQRQVVLRDESQGIDPIGDIANVIARESYPHYLKGLDQKLNDTLYLVDVLLFSDEREKTEKLVELAESLVHPNLKWSWKKYKDWKKVLKILNPPRITLKRLIADSLDITAALFDRILWGIKYPNTTYNDLNSWFKLPDPSVHKTIFSRGLKIPALPKREDGFRIGETEDGREVRIGIEDLTKHVYCIGMTGTGKSTFFKLLVHRLRETYPDCAIVVIDPHGDLAEDLAEEFEDALYFHPIYSPFGVNPFDLPEGLTKEHSISLGRNAIIDLFTDILELPEIAQYVKFILRVTMNLVYRRVSNPTIDLIYKVVDSVRSWSDDILVDDDLKEYVKELRGLYEFSPQSYTSTLVRLEQLNGDPILKKLTTKTTVPFKEIIKPGKLTLFSLPISYLHKDPVSLLGSTILLRLWFEVLARARDPNSERTPVFVLCDEFQVFKGLATIEIILSQARKFGLHVIIGHQHTKQIDEKLLQSALNNTGLKLIFNVHDVDVFRKIDPSFAKEIEGTVTNLPKGYALIQFSSGDELNPPPFVVKLDYPDYPPVRDINEACSYSFSPPPPSEDSEEILKEIFNPVTRFIPKPAPVEQLILYALYKNGGSMLSGDLYTAIPADRGQIEKALSNLNQKGLVTIERRGSRKPRVIRLSADFFEEFFKVSPSSKGYELIKTAVEYYISKNYYVSPAKQIPGEPRPDLVVIPLSSPTSSKLDYSNAIAVELETHPDVNLSQFIVNLTKESTEFFKEIHVWTFSEYKSIVEDVVKDFENIRVFYVPSGSDVEKEEREGVSEVKKDADEKDRVEDEEGETKREEDEEVDDEKESVSEVVTVSEDEGKSNSESDVKSEIEPEVSVVPTSSPQGEEVGTNESKIDESAKKVEGSREDLKVKPKDSKHGRILVGKFGCDYGDSESEEGSEKGTSDDEISEERMVSKKVTHRIDEYLYGPVVIETVGDESETSCVEKSSSEFESSEAPTPETKFGVGYLDVSSITSRGERLVDVVKDFVEKEFGDVKFSLLEVLELLEALKDGEEYLNRVYFDPKLLFDEFEVNRFLVKNFGSIKFIDKLQDLLEQKKGRSQVVEEFVRVLRKYIQYRTWQSEREVFSKLVERGKPISVNVSVDDLEKLLKSIPLPASKESANESVSKRKNERDDETNGKKRKSAAKKKDDESTTTKGVEWCSWDNKGSVESEDVPANWKIPDKYKSPVFEGCLRLPSGEDISFSRADCARRAFWLIDRGYKYELLKSKGRVCRLIVYDESGRPIVECVGVLRSSND